MALKSHNKIDIALLDGARKGDQKAYTALLEKYRKSVYYLILKIVRSPEDAEDLMIESFSKAFDHLDQYSPEYAFSTWLYKITSNTCIDFLRKKKIDKVSLENNDGTVLDNLDFITGTNPELDLIKSQRIDKMQHAVSTMDEIFSRVIALRYFKEYSYEEISEELGIPIGTIKVQLHRAKKLLQNKFLDEKDKW
ncbi:MAG: sigma-70 family polymerase sigma factor [Bacteroidota bacterium]|nr:sigma-70 family polymerase sigma factor [Bacteroidota bacterium]